MSGRRDSVLFARYIEGILSSSTKKSGRGILSGGGGGCPDTPASVPSILSLYRASIQSRAVNSILLENKLRKKSEYNA